MPVHQRPLSPVPLGDLRPFVPTSTHPVRVRARAVPANTHFESHRHAWGQLVYCRAGLLRANVAARAREAATSCIVPPSRALWIAPSVTHSVTALEATQLQTLYITADALSIEAGNSRVITVSALLREIVPALHQAAQHPDDGQRLGWLMRLALDEIARAPTLALGVPLPAPEGGDKRLRALCEAIIDAPAERVTLAEWSRRVGTSERTTARLFRDELGTSYQQWRQQVVLAHALPLLARRMPVGQVAAACGYASESAFTAMFRAALGQTPSEFRG